jgi:hypothetical protein
MSFIEQSMAPMVLLKIKKEVSFRAERGILAGADMSGTLSSRPVSLNLTSSLLIVFYRRLAARGYYVPSVHTQSLSLSPAPPRTVLALFTHTAPHQNIHVAEYHKHLAVSVNA